MTAFTLTVDPSGIARLVFDLPGEKVNKFSAVVVTELNALLDDLGKRAGVKALVVTSGKTDVFVAGADIRELQTISTTDEAYAKARAGQMLFQRVADLPFPSVAAIDGACLGGGMEFALACTYRVVTDEPKTSLGLPEVSLGILPGWGGTQRLPALVGLGQALEMILPGKPLNGPKAYKAGLADRCVARAFLPADLASFVAEILTPGGRAKVLARRAQRPFARKLADSALMRPVVWSKARKELMRKTRGMMPAPLKALEVIRQTRGMPLAQGLEVEARGFAGLAVTPECRCLIDLFFATETVKKEGMLPKPSSPVPGGQGEARSLGGGAPQQTAGKSERSVATAGVLGAGVMGGGIAWLFADKGMQVRVKDIAWEAVAKAYKTASEYNATLVKIRKLTHQQAAQRLLRIGGSIDFTGFASADVVVEAVVEDLGVKRKVLAEVERHVRDDCVLASNTSSLSVAAMAESLAHPERFVGMHFFNPVNRMPLVEVVAGPRSSPEAVALVANLARRCGKTAIVVKDCAGFLVNRILLPYMNEAARLLQEGGDLERIDQVIYRFGMPMGPFTLTDEVGIDVGHKVAKILATAYGERMAVAEILAKVHEELKLLGAKAGKGFYLHEGKERRINPDIDAAVAGTQGDLNLAPRAISDAEILDRCLLIMVNEASRCIEEGIVASPAVLDLAMVMGTGFPPQRGGPLHHADTLGPKLVVARLRELSAAHGMRFAPSPLLVRMAQRDVSFFSADFASVLPVPVDHGTTQTA